MGMFQSKWKPNHDDYDFSFKQNWKNCNCERPDIQEGHHIDQPCYCSNCGNDL